jgi:hypothetical protein
MVESPLNHRFHINATTSLSHTGQSSGAYNELCKTETDDGAMWPKHVAEFI